MVKIGFLLLFLIGAVAFGVVGPAAGQITPTITAVEPALAPNAVTTTLTVRGTEFMSSTVSMPLVGELLTVEAGEGTLTALLPAGLPAGVYDVQVRNGDGGQGTLSQALTVFGPTGIQPDSVSNQSDVELVVTGVGFADGAVVILDGHGALATTHVSGSLLRALLPAGAAPGTYNVRVVNPDAGASILANALTVRAPAAAPTPTGTPAPTQTPAPTAFVRPVLVVQSYGASSPVITPGQDLDFEITVANSGQAPGTNIIANFVSGDFVPRVTGGVYAVGTLGVGQSARFWQPLTASRELAGKSTGVLEVKVSYTDANGTAYTESFALTFPIVRQAAAGSGTAPTPTPTPTATPAPRLRPQLLVTHYDSDVAQLEPGSRFQLSLDVRNQGNADARRVTMILGGGNSSEGTTPDGTPAPGGGLSGAGGEFSNFAPVGASNVSFLGELAVGDSLHAETALIVNASTKPGAYPVVVGFVYQDATGSSYMDEQVITLLVYGKPAVAMNFYMEPPPLFVGQPGPLPLQLVNVGKNSTVFGNLTVTAEGAQLTNNTVFVGALEPGGFFPLDAQAIAEQPGPLTLLVGVGYTDDFNQPQVLTETLTVEVMEAPPMEAPPSGGPDGEGYPGMLPEGMPPAAGETMGQKIWRFVRGMVGLSSGPALPQPAGATDGMPQEMPIDGPGPVAPYRQ